MTDAIVTMVFTDLVSSTAMKTQLPGTRAEQNRLYWETILMPHRQRIEANLADYSGRVVKTAGDGYFLVFTEAVKALQWAVSVQISHLADPIPTPLGNAQVKIGLHTGSPIADGDDFIGLEVDYAARLVSLANGEQIVLSEATAQAINNLHQIQVRVIAPIPQPERPARLYDHGSRYLRGIGSVPVFELLYIRDTPHPLKEAIDWRKACQQVLAEKYQLTTNPLMATTSIHRRLDQVYVPLGLVERRQMARIPEGVKPSFDPTTPPTNHDLPSDDAADAATDYQVTQTFQAQQFFEQVLRQGQSQLSAGRRLAIIGEPGAGKTTLLQKIGDWIVHNTDDLPMWVSLADLQGKSLEAYLLGDWLKTAILNPLPTTAMQQELIQQFQRGRVWLLLDAVDEMVGNSEGRSSLQEIAQQLTGWLTQARIVLTCRVNVWDVEKNFLDNFDVYRNLNFSPSQVQQFIQQWFADVPPQFPPRSGGEGLDHLGANFTQQDEETDLAKGLMRALQKPGRERIYDAVRNPFRLSMLCHIWQQWQGNLPATKAALYGQFVQALYRWKQEAFPTSPEQQQQLNTALGKLALRAIEQSGSRFRLRHDRVCAVLGGPETPLFQLAIQLGWLNQLGLAAEDPSQRVYAFYHPTFQEYFAAQSIPHWHFFLHIADQTDDLQAALTSSPSLSSNPHPSAPLREQPQSSSSSQPSPTAPQQQTTPSTLHSSPFTLHPSHPTNPSHSKPPSHPLSYRIFEPQWKEVILLWLGRQDIASNHKEAFLRAMVTFNDGCDHFYRYRAWLLAAAGIAEFKACKQAETIVQQVVQWGFRERPEATLNFMQPLTIAAHQTLTETHRALAVRYLQPLLAEDQPDAIRSQAADLLREIDPGNPELVQVLTDLLHIAQDSDARFQAANILGKIDPGNPLAVTTLVKLLVRRGYTAQVTIPDIIRSLGEVGGDNPLAIRRLLELLINGHPEAADSLIKLGMGNTSVIQTLLKQLPAHPGSIAPILTQVGGKHPAAIAGLTQLLFKPSPAETQYWVADTLATIDPTNDLALKTLRDLLRSGSNSALRLQVAKTLGTKEQTRSGVTQVLLELLKTSSDEAFRQQVIVALGEVAVGDEAAIAALETCWQSTQDQQTYWLTLRSLGKLWPSPDPSLIDWLIDLAREHHSALMRQEAALSLWEIAKVDRQARNWLPDLLHALEEPALRWQTAQTLANLGDDSPSVIRTLSNAMQTAAYREMRQQAALCLGKIGLGNPKVVQDLLTTMRSTQDVVLAQVVAIALGDVGVGSPEAIQGLLDVVFTTRDRTLHQTAVEALKKLLQGPLLAEAVTAMRYFCWQGDSRCLRRCFDLLWHCAQTMTYPAFYQAYNRAI